MTQRLRAGDLALVAVGGAVGAVLRWGLGEVTPDGSGFPWTTFAINVAGCLALGLLPIAVARDHRLTLLLGPGLLGGFTTVSTYADQARGLTADGHAGLAGTYVVCTLAAALAAAAVGRRLAHRSEPEDALT
ncbi:FluC/FEX family fluoride channel [Nocardioides allogilvus]|uniref:FluC/FEX family fluoride channel n=1 Tax=Nocardioides allogilvus TaxID=2072017 RepID=UPI000D2F9F9B|nr:CrcB family protein [Nocardioides allogilvus]